LLLENKTPLPVISELLGHKSIQSSMCYLRIDIESLRQCALDDVPPVPESFYTQKGGAFYV
jgi:site-specific recombinase XerD